MVTISPFKKILKGTVVVLSGNAAIYFFAFVYQIFISRSLGPESFGIYGLVNSIYVTFAQVSTLGIGYYLVYYLGKVSSSAAGEVYLRKEELLKTTILISVGFSGLVTVLMAVSGVTWLKRIYDIPRISRLVFVMSPAVIFYSLLSMTESVFRGEQNATKAYGIKIFPEAMKFVLIPVFLVFISKDVSDLIMLLVVIQMLAVLYALFSFNKYELPLSSVLWSPPASVLQTRKIIKYSLPFFLKDIIQVLRERADTFLVAYIMSSYYVGIYRSAYIIGTTLSLIPIGMGYMLFPILSGLKDGKNDALSFDFVAGRTLKYMIYLAVPSVIFIVLFSREILFVVFGARYVIGAKALILLALAYGMSIFYVIPGMTLAIKEKTDFIFYAEFMSFLVGLSGSVFLIPRYGITGAALGGLGGVASMILLMNLFAHLSVKKVILPSRAMWLLPLLLVVVLFMLVGGGVDFSLFSKIVIFTAAIAFILLWVVVVEKEEVRSVISFVVAQYDRLRGVVNK